jgi:hypothetical protein
VSPSNRVVMSSHPSVTIVATNAAPPAEARWGSASPGIASSPKTVSAAHAKTLMRREKAVIMKG